MKLHRLSFLAGAAFAVAAVALASILGFGARTTEAQGDAMAAAQRAQLIAVTYQLDSAGFHQLDETLNSGTFVPGALGTVHRARVAMQSTMWPTDNDEKATADNMVTEMIALEGALRDENVTAAAPHAHQVHELGHKISDQTYAWLSAAMGSTPGQAPMDMGDDDHMGH
jgi:hypothetical protein